MTKQTIIVTGAASGIGFGIAKYFLDRGDNVFINSFDEGKLEAAYIQLGAGENLARLAGDVGVKSTGIALAAKAVEQFGSIDVLVNNAGLYGTKPFLDVDEGYIDRFLRTNLKGTFFTSQAVIPQMMKQKDGVIINISTAMVRKAIAGVDATAAIASKGAIDALTIQLAGEFGKFNIRANVLALGVIGVGEVGDVAEMVYAVAKNKFMTGAIIPVDGGIGAGTPAG